MDPDAWLRLGGFHCSEISERAFRAHFGISSFAVSHLWRWIIQEPLKPLFSGIHLLWTLYFLKCSSSSWEQIISFWHVKDERTFKKWVWYTLNLIDSILPEFDFEDRWEKWKSKVPSFIIDTTTISIQEPYQFSWECHTHNHKGAYIKYQIVCALGVSRIIYFCDP